MPVVVGGASLSGNLCIRKLHFDLVRLEWVGAGRSYSMRLLAVEPRQWVALLACARICGATCHHQRLIVHMAGNW